VRGVRYRYSDGGETTEEGYSDGGIPSTDRRVHQVRELIDGRAWLRPQFSAMVQGPATLVHRGNSVHGP
jgi:hypothetical protein